MVAMIQIKVLLCLLLASYLPLGSCRSEDPSPTPWPKQFHAQTFIKYEDDLSIVDLWYDWPNGRSFNIIQHQLSYKLWDVEWTNGTSYYYDLEAKTCKTVYFPVGILPPDWLVDQSHYLGVQELDGFTCNVWEKADFITYYEDVETHNPVGWVFRTTGRSVHLITFEAGAVLPDLVWQAPPYCFSDSASTEEVRVAAPFSLRMHDDGQHLAQYVVPLSSTKLGRVENSDGNVL